MVVNLPVENGRDAAVGAEGGLRALPHVDDGQPPHAQEDFVFEVDFLM